MKLAHCKQATRKVSDVPGGKRTSLSKGAIWALVLIKAGKKCGRKAKLSVQTENVLHTFSRVKPDRRGWQGRRRVGMWQSQKRVMTSTKLSQS